MSSTRTLTRGVRKQTNFPRAGPSADQPAAANAAQDTSEVHAAAAAIVLAGCGHVAAADEAGLAVSFSEDHATCCRDPSSALWDVVPVMIVADAVLCRSFAMSLMDVSGEISLELEYLSG